jgi:hypothetical protein
MNCVCVYQYVLYDATVRLNELSLIAVIHCGSKNQQPELVLDLTIRI